MVKRERIIEEKGNEIEKLQKVIQHLEEVSNFFIISLPYVLRHAHWVVRGCALPNLCIQVDQNHVMLLK